MAQMDLLEIILMKIKSGTPALLREAENQTKQWEEENLTTYAFTLCTYISHPKKEIDSRLLAGILLKGTLHSKDVVVNKAKHQKWLTSVPEDAKFQIKKGLLSTLASDEVKARQISAQVISSIALVELPQGKWPELVPLLLENVTNPQAPPNLKQATLDTIGYICEEITPDVLSAHAHNILTAVVHGMRPTEQNPQVKRSACTALYNALYFCRQNFENNEERDVLMNVILQAATNSDEDVRVAAYEVLVEVASIHYEKLPPYMQDIFKVTLEAIRGSEPTAKQAIEFWCTICDEEIAIIDDHEYATECNGPIPPRKCQYYVKGALQYIIPMLTETLTRQTEDGDPDEWTISMAGSTCLGLISQVVEDDVVPHVMPFVEKHLLSQDWRFREAAVLAFGSILEGPQHFIGTLVTQATPVLINHMKDTKTAVRDTTAWTLGRICKMHHKSILLHAENILKVMGEALTDKPRVASNASWAIHNLAYSFRDEESNPLTKYFSDVVGLLFNTSDRKDGDEENLRMSSYEALNVVLTTSPPSTIPALEQIVGVVFDRLDKTFLLEIVSQDDQNKQNELQGLLCGVLQVLTSRLDKRIKPHADRMMSILLRLLKSKADSSVYEECFLTIAALANVVDSEFQKYMPEFHECLYNGLGNWQEYQVCSVAVGLVGDISRALVLNLLPYCDRIVTLLLQNLSNKNLDRNVKPPILSCFGDIALAISGNFEKYLEVVMGMLKQAAQTVVSTNLEADDYELVEYINLLREGILEAYTGIIQGLREDGKGELIGVHVNTILNLIVNVANDQRRSDAVARCASGICGDLALCLGNRIRTTLQQSFVQQLLNSTLTMAESKETKKTAEWARGVISTL